MSTVGRKYDSSELPLGKLDANKYSKREYIPLEPPLPASAVVVAVFEPPSDRIVLEHIYQLFSTDMKVQNAENQVTRGHEMKILDEKDLNAEPLVEKDLNVQSTTNVTFAHTAQFIGHGNSVQMGKSRMLNPFRKRKRTETAVSSQGMCA